MNNKPIKLQKKDSTEYFFSKLLKIPLPLYVRMIDERGLKWGEVTKFILDAIKEKLDREKDVREKFSATPWKE